MASSSEFPAAGPAGNPPVALSHHTPGNQSFTLLHDKNMLAPASASSWCPTMDLLALATTDGQLSLSRLEWNKQGGERENKLWSTNPDAPVTSLGWRPDGKVLVSGHADGTVVLHHVEDGETLHVSKPHARAVTSLHWQIAPASDAARSAFAHQSAAARFTLPPRRSGAEKGGGAAAAAGGAKTRGANAFRSALVDHFDPPDRLTVLVSGDARGTIALAAFGVVPLGSADLTTARGAGIRENLRLARRNARDREGRVAVADVAAEDDAKGKNASASHGVVVQHATASPDLSRVLVGFGITAPSRTNVGDDESATTSVASRNEIVASYVAVARVPLLAARSRELRDIAAHAAALAAANDAVRERVAAAAAAWRRARGGFAQAASLLARRAREEHEAHASARRLEARANPRDASSAASSEPLGMVSLEDRFMALLAVGDVDLVLERFLSHEFDAAAARRVAKQIDAAATETHRTLLRDVGPAAETASVRVAELRAYARWRERTASVGLDETAMDAAVVAAERVALAAAAAARVATETATGFRAFFALVLRAQRVLAGKSPDGDEANAIPTADPALCRAFLERGLEADALGAQLESLEGDGNETAGAEDEDEDEKKAPRDGEKENRNGTVGDGHAEARAGYAASRASFLASVRGAAAAAGFVRADEEKHLPPLWRAAAAFRGACASALEGPATAVSASFAWRRAFPVVAAGADAGGKAKAPRATHGGFADWSAWDAPKEAEEATRDEGFEGFEDGSVSSSSAFETVVFHAGAASAAGKHSVGLLALRDGVPEKALAMELPEGQEIVDAAAYTKGRVLALCQPAGGANADPSRGLGPASVVMLDPRSAAREKKSAFPAGAFGLAALARRDDGDDFFDAAALEGEDAAALEHASAPPGCAPASSVASVSFGGGHGVVDMADEDAAPPRRRALPGLEATAPLAVGPSKGLAAVLVGSRRIALLDLEEDECDEDDSDEDEEEHE